MRRVFVLALLLAACRSEPQKRDVVAPAPGPRYRTAASGFRVDPALAGRGTTAMVASEDVHASQVGKDVLAQGGTAADAAVAAAFVLAVTHPSAGNVAGGGFAIVRSKKREAAALDFRETAPGAATATMFLDESGNPTRESVGGHKASGVPGSVAGLWALHQKFGKARWPDLIAPAIKFAQDGFPIGSGLHASLIRFRKTRSTAAAPLWWPNGEARREGEILKNPELATVLRRISAQGPKGFYRGETATAIVAEMQRGGGIITAADLAGYSAVWRTPLKFRYRDHELYAMPPPSSGGIAIAMTANMLRNTDVRSLGWHSASHVHLLVEVWRRAFAARNELLGDPAYVPDMPVAQLTSERYADRLVATITARATPSKTVPAMLEGTHTTNLVVVDKDGMAVALTTTLNTAFGSGIMVSGFLLNNEMDDFTAKPGAPNQFGLVQGAANKIQPGKRMLSSMSPIVVEDRNGDVAMVLSGQGGARIITEVWQTLSNVLDFGMPVEAAIAAPRIHHQHLPDEVIVEDEAIQKDVEIQLKAAGHVLVWNQPQRIYGAVEAVVWKNGSWFGAADPRNGGAAVGD